MPVSYKKLFKMLSDRGIKAYNEKEEIRLESPLC